MFNPPRIKLYAFFLSAFFFRGFLIAQSNVLELLPGTEKIIFDEKSGANRLIGTVSFTYQGNTMFCDSAHYDEKRKIVHAYGNVHITKNTINYFVTHFYIWGLINLRNFGVTLGYAIRNTK